MDENKVYQVCFAGIGGQGVLLCARILGMALSAQGMEVIQTQSHGIEARGGASTGEVIYGHREINRLRANVPDVLLALSESALESYKDAGPKGAFVIYDSYMVKKPYQDPERKIYSAPFTAMAIEEFGNDTNTNLIALGFVNKVTGLVPEDVLFQAVDEQMKSKESCRKAVMMGIKKAEEL